MLTLRSTWNPLRPLRGAPPPNGEERPIWGRVGSWDREMLGGKEIYQRAGGSFEAHSAYYEIGGGTFGGEGYNWEDKVWAIGD